MPMIFLAAALSSLALAGADPSAAGAPPPSPLDAYYPPAARAAGVEGYVMLSCISKGDGSLSDCRVTEETPKDKGFGKASLRAAHLFRMDLKTQDGEPIEGVRVNIPIRWKLDHTAPPPGTRMPH
jgi:TonB family protein